MGIKNNFLLQLSHVATLCIVKCFHFCSNNSGGISKKLNQAEDTKAGALLAVAILLGWDFLFLLYCKIKPTEKCENLLVFLGCAFFVELLRSRKNVLLTWNGVLASCGYVLLFVEKPSKVIYTSVAAPGHVWLRCFLENWLVSACSSSVSLKTSSCLIIIIKLFTINSKALDRSCPQVSRCRSHLCRKTVVYCKIQNHLDSSCCCQHHHLYCCNF